MFDNWLHALYLHRPAPNAVTTPSKQAIRSQSVWVKEKSGSASSKSNSQSKVSLSLLVKRVSQVTEQFSDVSQRNSLDSPAIELSEQACVLCVCVVFWGVFLLLLACTLRPVVKVPVSISYFTNLFHVSIQSVISPNCFIKLACINYSQEQCLF